MAKNQKDLAESLLADDNPGWLTGFLADEDEFDRRALWRLASWGVGSLGAVIIAIMAHQSGTGLRHEQIAAADLARQSQQFQSIAKTNENEARRLASAIDTLNGDRDRLFARMTALEQGLDSVTGSINRRKDAQNDPAKASPPKDAALGSPQAATSSSPAPDRTPPSQASALPLSRAPATSAVATTTAALPAIPSDTRNESGESKTSLSGANLSEAAAPKTDSSRTTSASATPPSSPMTAPVASAATAETVIAKTSSTKPPPAKSSSADISSTESPADKSLSAKSASVAAISTIDPSAPTQISAASPAASKPVADEEESSATKSDDGNETTAATSAVSEPQQATASQSSKDAQIVTASLPAITGTEPASPSAPADTPVAHTDFGVDLGSASSIKGLRALWHGILKSDPKELASLRPIIVLKERTNGLGMQLRLVAGPLVDAAAAAKICAVLSENGRACETAVFDGQRLAMKEDNKAHAPTVTTQKPRSPRASRHHHSRRTARIEGPIPVPPPPVSPPPPKPSTFSSFFSR